MARLNETEKDAALSSPNPKPSIKSAFNKKAKKPLATGKIPSLDARRTKLKGQRFVITSAQNNTPVHENFLKSLESYC